MRRGKKEKECDDVGERWEGGSSHGPFSAL
jgi:hypothetical protein